LSCERSWFSFTNCAYASWYSFTLDYNNCILLIPSAHLFEELVSRFQRGICWALEHLQCFQPIFC
jgi:hypothetical protein